MLNVIINNIYIVYICFLGDFFSGKIANDYSQQLKLLNIFVGSLSQDFTGTEIKTETRVPMMRFFHEPTDFKSDLHFHSGFSTVSSQLVK